MPIRFGLVMRRLAPRGHFPDISWIHKMQKLEELGFSSFLITDHFNNQWEPTATLGAVAAVTQTLKVGSLVFCVDYRHPAVLAQASATLHLLSRGRFEFGIGAGWTKKEYKQAGFVYHKPSIRIERLEETLRAIKQIWIQEHTTFNGNYAHLSEFGSPTQLPEGEYPPIIVGGGGKKLLSVAARYADIVSIVPSWPKGQVAEENVLAHTLEGIRKKVEWVKLAAHSSGRNLDELELNTFFNTFTITENKQAVYDYYAKLYGLSSKTIAKSAFYLIGSSSEIQETIENFYKEFGISYFIIEGDINEFHPIEQFAKSVLQPLKNKLS